MDQIINFMESYALWIGIAGVVLLMGLIGFMFDSKRSKNKKNDMQDELGEPDVVITSDTVNILNQPSVSDTPVVVEPQAQTNTVVTDSLMQGNMPDLSAVAAQPEVENIVNQTPVAPMPSIEDFNPTVDLNVPSMETPAPAEVVMSIPEPVVEPVIEPVVQSTPIVETPVAPPEPVVETPVMSGMPDLSAFAYTPPVVETPQVAEVVMPAPEPVIQPTTPVIEPVMSEQIVTEPVVETSTAPGMPDLSAFAYAMPEPSTQTPESTPGMPQVPTEPVNNIVNQTPEL